MDFIKRPSVFGWLLLVSGGVLLIPLIAMQFTDQVNWTMSDFFITGVLLYGMGSLFILIARRIEAPSRQLWLGVVCILVFLYIWAELAVGIFTDFGS